MATEKLKQPERESWSVTVLRAVIYCMATTLFTADLSAWPGVLGGWVGVTAGMWLGNRMSASRLRIPFMVAISGFIVFLSFICESLIAGHSVFAFLLGPTGALGLLQFCTFGFLIGGVMAGLRAVGGRIPALRILEPMAAAALVVRLFVGHRDMQIGEPRFLSDWAFSRGQSPFLILMVLGVITLFIALLLLLEERRLRRAMVASVLLALLCSAVLFVGGRYKPAKELPPPVGGEGKDSKDKGQGKDGQSSGKQGGQGGKDGQNSGKSQEPPEPNQMDHKPPPPRQRDQKGKVIALVVFHDDVEPPEGAYYFRSNASSQFTGTKLVETTMPEADREVPRAFPTATESFPVPCPPTLLNVEVTTTVNLMDTLSRPLALTDALKLKARENANPELFLSSYDVQSRTSIANFEHLLRFPAGDPKWSEELKKHYVESPKDPRYLALAKEITARLGENPASQPMLAALLIRLWLEKHVIYSLKVDFSGTSDPTAEFLFSQGKDRRGYCVYIAHSMAFLLRALGIPSRVSAGFMAPAKRREQGSSVAIMSTDGHQWAELYLQGIGWVIMDVACERSEEPRPPEVNPETQRQLGDQAMKNRTPKEKREEATKKFSWKWWLYLLVRVIPVLLVMWVCGAKIWRRMASRFASAAHLYRVSYRGMLDRLTEVGIRRNFGETREAFADRLAPIIPAFPEITRAHLVGALKHEPPLPRQTWLKWEAEVRTALRQKISFTRRTLGFLNPISWFWTR